MTNLRETFDYSAVLREKMFLEVVPRQRKIDLKAAPPEFIVESLAHFIAQAFAPKVFLDPASGRVLGGLHSGETDHFFVVLGYNDDGLVAKERNITERDGELAQLFRFFWRCDPHFHYALSITSSCEAFTKFNVLPLGPLTAR